MKPFFFSQKKSLIYKSKINSTLIKITSVASPDLRASFRQSSDSVSEGFIIFGCNPFFHPLFLSPKRSEALLGKSMSHRPK